MFDFLLPFECVTRLPLSATDTEFDEECPVQLHLLIPDGGAEEATLGAPFCFESGED